MARHSKAKEHPIIRVLKAVKPAASTTNRLAKDIEIIDKGWNNTAEGQADLKTNGASRIAKSFGRHRK